MTAAYCEEDAATGLVKRRRPLGTGAIVRHVSAEGLGTPLGFFAWLNRLALKSLASTGLDALNKGVHRVAALLQEDPNEEVEVAAALPKLRYEGLPMAAGSC